MIRPHDAPLRPRAGFLNLKGNLFESAIMKTSVISDDFRAALPRATPLDPDAFEGRVVVFDGPEDYHDRIDDPALAIDERQRARDPRRRAGRLPRARPRSSTCVRRTTCCKRGIRELPCIGDGRQSGTSGSPSILNASPEAASGGGLALLRTGDRVRVDLSERAARTCSSPTRSSPRRREELQRAGGYRYPESQTPWQEIQRGLVDELAHGMVLKPAVAYQRIAHDARASRATTTELLGAQSGLPSAATRRSAMRKRLPGRRARR